MITLSGQLAEDITIERAIYLNEQGYAVTVEYGKVLLERENQ
jgi:ribulose bisphosphate carboxylase small subunit